MTSLRSQLRNHLCRIPVGAQSLNLAVLVDFENIDAFESHLAAVGTGASARPFHRGAIAGDENAVFSKRDALEVLANRGKEIAYPATALNSRGPYRIIGRSVFGKSVGKRVRVHGANGQEISAHR